MVGGEIRLMGLSFKIGKSLIAKNSKTYFIADIAANHDGSLKRALKLIKLAARSGANAAKFQHFKAETIVSDYGFKSLKKDLKGIANGVYLAELIDTFGDERTQNVQLLRILVEGLTFLDRSLTSDILIRKFEMNLLNICGFAPELANCVSCRQKLSPDGYLFDLTQGGVLCGSCEMQAVNESQRLSLNAMKMMRLLKKNVADLSVLSELDLADSVKLEIENILRKYLRFVAERDLRSTRFVDHIETLSP